MLKEMHIQTKDLESWLWLKMVENTYNFTAFLSRSTIFTAFTAFAGEWPPYFILQKA